MNPRGGRWGRIAGSNFSELELRYSRLLQGHSLFLAIGEVCHMGGHG
jgi:hypothetical protein